MDAHGGGRGPAVAAPEADGTDSSSNRPKRGPLARLLALPLPLLAFLATLIVGLARISQPGYWYDEGATIDVARRTTGEIFEVIQNVDLVHAASYLVVHWWSGVFGWSELPVRLPFLLGLCFAGAGLALIAERWCTKTIALWVTVFFVINATLASTGIEARGYAIAFACSIWAVVALMRALRTGAVWAWAAYAVLTILACYFFLYTLLIAILHLVVVWLTVRRPVADSLDSGTDPAAESTLSFRRVAISFVASWAVISAAVLPFALAAWSQRGQVDWIVRTWVDLSVSLLFGQVFLGPRNLLNESLWIPFFILAAIVAPAAWIMLLAWAYAWVKAVHGSFTMAGFRDWLGGILDWVRGRPTVHDQAILRSWAIGLAGYFGPTWILFLQALVTGSFFMERYLAFTVPWSCFFFATGLAWAFSSARPPVRTTPPRDASDASAKYSSDDVVALSNDDETSASTGQAVALLSADAGAVASPAPSFVVPRRIARIAAVLMLVAMAIPTALQAGSDSKVGDSLRPFSEQAAGVDAIIFARDQMRSIQSAYPEPLGDAVDLNLGQSGVETATLWGENDDNASIAGYERIAVYYPTYSEEIIEQYFAPWDERLRAVGCTVTGELTKPWTGLVLYSCPA
ncbi:MAG: hypothetical protein LBM23_00990 [Propionibacteriaceae bacterium]|jgi:hypothetical protein|nr:hypothetical protein [Propionibacteriaceae bacterium]